MELLEPLTVLDIRLAPGHLTDSVRIDQLDVKPVLFEHFEQGNPIHPGRLHHHGVKLTLTQLLGQGIEIGSKRSKALHRLLIAITGHGHPVGFCPHIMPAALRLSCSNCALLTRLEQHFLAWLPP